MHCSLLLRALLLLAMSVAAFRAPQDVEIVTEFKQYFKQYKDTPTRVEAVLSLEGTDSPSVVTALLPVLKLTAEPEVVRAAIRVLAGFKTRPPVDLMVQELEGSKDEGLRMGLLEAMTQGKYDGVSGAVAKLLGEKSFQLRRRAVETLCASPEPDTGPLVLGLVKDSEPAVRCAALEGLARMHSELVVDAAIAALNDSIWQVRASAALALKSVRAKRSIGPLIERMKAEEGRLRVDYSEALTEITGRGFGQELEGWVKFWETFGDKFEIPTDADLARLRAKQQENKARYSPPGVTNFGGIETPSRSILFIIDVSGSMESMIVEKERFQDGGYPGYSRIEIVRTELVRTLERLESYVRFNVISFATDVNFWKKGLVPANVLNKSSAMDYARRLEAIGGNSKDDLAAAGLVGSANLGAGKTNTYGALMAGLGAAGQGAKDKEYAVEVDTIFFLSDGRPSVGHLVDIQEILRAVREANLLRKVVVHTIAIGEFQKEFMRQLALENGGVFVDLGR